jgi:hypothetical protein
MEHLSLYRGSVRGTWTEDSHIGGSERRVTEGSGNSAFILYGSIESYKINARVNLRHLAGRARPISLLGRNLCLIYSYSLEGLCPYIWSQHTKGCFSLGSGKLDPDITRKTYPRLIMAFIKEVGLG